MAASSVAARPAARSTELQMSRKWKNRETSPERNMVWTEPHNNSHSSKIKSSSSSNGRRVPVIYYLSRNGQLEHPHFMEVPLYSSHGLFLNDVINRLNVLRGNGLAFMYSWSCKRSYKSGYVWHDLTENDFIYPAHGQEYILKGSEILEAALVPKCKETELSASFREPPQVCRKDDDPHSGGGTRQRNQSWSSFDFRGGIPATDASTQSDEKFRHRRAIREIEEDKIKEALGNHNTEIIIRDEISEVSPPPSDSSSETLETLMKADRQIILRPETINEDPTVNISQFSGRGKASTVLMQLFSCASIGFRDCGPGGHSKGNVICVCPQNQKRGGGSRNQVRKDAGYDMVGSLISELEGRLKGEDKAYFSGSLIQTKKEEFPALKRSSSYNADRMFLK